MTKSADEIEALTNEEVSLLFNTNVFEKTGRYYKLGTFLKRKIESYQYVLNNSNPEHPDKLIYNMALYASILTKLKYKEEKKEKPKINEDDEYAEFVM